ncbi:MAG: replication initiator protein A [Cetobacterium sp.]
MNAIKKEDLSGFFHVQIPRVVWEMFINKEITQSTFKVYVELFDRLKVSAYNGWIDKEGDVYLKFSYPELMDMLKVKSKGTISTALDELEKLSLIIKKRGYSTSTKFYLTNVLQKSKKSDFCKKEEAEVQKKEPQKSKKSDSQKSKKLDPNNNNFNHNNLIIKTTTELDYIYPIDNPDKKNSSSSISKEIKELKKYLMDYVQDTPTCKNIMFLVENRELTLERIKTVVEYAKKQNKNNGYIYKALEENWDIPGISNVKKEAVRGHKENLKAIATAKESKDAVMQYTETLEQLTERYNSLDEKLKNEIDKLALEKALKINPVERMAKVLVRTTTRLEVLRQYIQEGKI